MGHLNSATSLNDSALERRAACCMTGSSEYLNYQCACVPCTSPGAPRVGGYFKHCPPRPREALHWAPSSGSTQYSFHVIHQEAR